MKLTEASRIGLKEKLDELAYRHNTPAFIEKDPVQFPRRYTNLQDIETAAFVTATISWGNRAAILKSAGNMLEKMGRSPYDFIMEKGHTCLGRKNIHRTFFEHDLFYLCNGLKHIYSKHASLEELFSSSGSVWEGIEKLRDELGAANGHTSSKHLSNPLAGSACKRLHMMLRWLVRQDGIVDLGVWKKLSPSSLYIPLDTHVARISRLFGLLERKTNDRKSVEELTGFLRSLNPEDPVLYDFALFGAGLEGSFRD